VIDIKPICSALANLTQVHQADLFGSAKGEMVLAEELVAKHFV
jgi:hypothetical protein